ncbi:MAG: cation:proton antiporter, partial [Hylemonella sp.]
MTEPSIDFLAVTRELAWPLALLLAGLAGELGHRWSRLPRISLYALVGFVLAPTQAGLLPQVTPEAVILLANIGFGLILFEAGHRINLAWLRHNPWLPATSLVEAGLTFGAVWLLAQWYGLPVTTTALLAALAMATSPAAIVRVINEQGSSGQVTERLLHLSVLNCVLAVFAFKIVVGLVVFGTSGNIWQAIHSSAVVLLASALLGMLFGHIVPALLRATERTVQDSTLAFALAVVALVMLTHALRLSPLLATLTFGLMARHRRMVLNPSQRGFGTLGELLTLLLFVFVSATLQWQHVITGLGLGLGLIGARAGQAHRHHGAFAPGRHHLAQGRADRPGHGADLRVRHPAAGTDPHRRRGLDGAARTHRGGGVTANERRVWVKECVFDGGHRAFARAIVERRGTLLSARVKDMPQCKKRVVPH